MNEEPKITLGDLLTEWDAINLTDAVNRRDRKHTVHNAVMHWLVSQPEVMERLRINGVIKAYAAILFEYHLELQ